MSGGLRLGFAKVLGQSIVFKGAFAYLMEKTKRTKPLFKVWGNKSQKNGQHSVYGGAL